MIWTIVTVVGPILLLAALAWAIFRNRKARTPERVTEAGTRRLYEEEEQRRRTGTDDAEH
jgi:hypothetical protein